MQGLNAPIVHYGQRFSVVQVMDISGQKPDESRKVFLRYAQTPSGVLVQIAHVDDQCVGTGTNFYVDQVDEEVVRSVAERVGMQPGDLIKAIADNAPNIEQVQVYT